MQVTIATRQLVSRGPGLPVQDAVLPQAEERFHHRVVASGTNATHRPDESVRIHILHSAQVERAFIGSILGDVGQLQLVRSMFHGLSLHQFVAHRQAGLLVFAAALLAERGPPLFVRTDLPRGPLSDRLPSLACLVQQDSVAELGVGYVGIEEGVVSVGRDQFTARPAGVGLVES